ncbi:MAG: hypothetical protein ACI9LM_005300 [Alteromonadaceae bacterium]|jgi:hypothetical protein
MSKTIQSMIIESEEKRDMWQQISEDNVALKDRNKTKRQADALANYFEGQFDGLCYARDQLNLV